jgi:hypothetical protein
VSIPASELVPEELGAAVELLQPYWSSARLYTFLGSSHSLSRKLTVVLDALVGLCALSVLLFGQCPIVLREAPIFC